MTSARPIGRGALCLGLAALGSLGLAACGSGAGSTSSSAPTPPSGRPATTTSAAPREKPAAAKPTGKASHSSSPTQPEGPSAALRRSAGRAAPFLVPQGDNSVPTFGSEASASERAGAEATLKAYLQARARADWAAACRQLAASTRAGYEKLAASSPKAKAGGCPVVLAALSKGADLSDPLTGHLLSLRVHGANAFALFYGPGHRQYIVPMNREGGAWRLTQTAPIGYPPGASGTASR